MCRTDYGPNVGLDVRYKSVGNASTMHPNTVAIEMVSGKRKMNIVGESRGGGVIQKHWAMP